MLRLDWSVARSSWRGMSALTLVDDTFLAPVSLRYTPPTAADALPLVLAAVERFVRRLAAARPGSARPGSGPAMKIWGRGLRTEEDIVEAFVRHNLTILDGMLVVDHNSTDRTPAILTALCAERLPLVVKRHGAPGYLQADDQRSA